ncbi:MAG TPA: hypothetical protein VIO80_07675 [Candidatus Dormibacteraeota bacterium]|jgi:hypothetical protein
MTQFAIALSSLALLMAAFTLWRNDLRGASLRINIFRTPTEWSSAQLSAVLDSKALLLPVQVDPWLFHEHVKDGAQLHVIAVCSCAALIVNVGPRGGSIWNIDARVSDVPAPWDVGGRPARPAKFLRSVLEVPLRWQSS